MTTICSPELLEVDAKKGFKSLPPTEVEEKLGS